MTRAAVSKFTRGDCAIIEELHKRGEMTLRIAYNLFMQGSSWFSSESGKKGAVAPGQFADLAALTDDYLSVPECPWRKLTSTATSATRTAALKPRTSFSPASKPPATATPAFLACDAIASRSEAAGLQILCAFAPLRRTEFWLNGQAASIPMVGLRDCKGLAAELSAAR